MEFEFEDQPKKEFQELPEELYTVTITQALLNTSEERPVINWEFTICDGDFSTRRMWDNFTLTPKNKYFLNRDFLSPLGLTINAASELTAALTKAMGMKVKLMREKSDYTNPQKPDKVYYKHTVTELLEKPTVNENEIPF